jgi:hypothetical protein
MSVTPEVPMSDYDVAVQILEAELGQRNQAHDLQPFLAARRLSGIPARTGYGFRGLDSRSLQFWSMG